MDREHPESFGAEDPDSESVPEILDATPGAWSRTQEGIEQARRGEGIPLDELDA